MADNSDAAADTAGGVAQGAMVGGVPGAFVGGAVGLAGSLMGGRARRKAAKKAEELARQNAAIWAAVKIPTIEEQKIILQNPELMGQYSPEQLQYMGDVSTSMEGVAANEATVAAQNDSLKGISEVAKGGFTEGDAAGMRQAQRGVSQDASARQKSILNAMASRGTLGSGMELAANLQSNQMANNQMADSSDKLIQAAQARSLQALTQQGTLAGSMRQQDVGEKTDIARARDQIARFNNSNRQNISDSNIGERNSAQKANLNARQIMENNRAGTANLQQEKNVDLIRTNYGDRVDQATHQTGGNSAIAAAQIAALNQKSNEQKNLFGSIASGAMQGYRYPTGGQTQQKSQQERDIENYQFPTTVKKYAGPDNYNSVTAATGGHITGPGTPTSDSIPARLSNGEFVIKADVVKKPGVLDFLHNLNNGEHPVHKYAQGGLVQGEPTPEDVANFGTPDDMTSAPVAEVAAPTVLDPRYTDAMDQSARLRGQAGLLGTFLGAMEGSGGGYKADRTAVDSLNRMSEDPMSKYKQLIAQETAAKAGKKEAAKESRDIESHKMNLDKGALDLESGKLGNTKSQLDIDKAQRAADSDIELDDKDSSASQFARARGQKKMADLGYKVPITENMTARQISSLPGMKEDLDQFFKDKEQSKTLAGAKDIAVLNRTSAEKIAEIGADAKSESNKEKVAANDEKDMDKDVKALTKHLTLGWAARGGQAGVIQNKINSAEAAEALIDQGRKQPGGLDSRQIEEVAQSTAKLLGGGNTASARVEALVPHTMMGRAQTFKEWLSNKPQGQEMQEFVDRLGETITREKVLALKQKQQFQVSGLSAHNRLKQKHPDLYRETLLANKIDPDTVDSVKMMGPDGKVRFIPKDQVEAAKKAGGKEVKE